MNIQILKDDFCICKLPASYNISGLGEFCFMSKTDGELSLLCPARDLPPQAVSVSEGWRGFRFCGTLDFSLIGILNGVTAILSERGISIFAVSTFDTDYVFTRAERFDEAIKALINGGYNVITP